MKRVIIGLTVFLALAVAYAKDCDWKEVFRFPTDKERGGILVLVPENFKAFGQDVVDGIRSLESSGYKELKSITIHRNCKQELKFDKVESADSIVRDLTGAQGKIAAAAPSKKSSFVRHGVVTGAAFAAGFTHPAAGLATHFVLEPVVGRFFRKEDKRVRRAEILKEILHKNGDTDLLPYIR